MPSGMAIKFLQKQPPLNLFAKLFFPSISLPNDSTLSLSVSASQHSTLFLSVSRCIRLLLFLSFSALSINNISYSLSLSLSKCKKSSAMANNTGSGTEPSNISPANPVEDNGGKRILEQCEIEIDEQFRIDPNDLKFQSVISDRPNSIVFAALYKSLPVAAKVLAQGQTPDKNAESKKMFLREVTMLSRVNHDNAVKFVGAYVESELAIITELMKGGSLRKYLSDMHPCHLDLQTSIRFAIDIARVMEYLHANRIIHRDLKPSNLLLTEDQKHLKLADFGLAREETDEEMTAEVGTHIWMAPEVYSTEPLPRGRKKHYDHKVDIYSFAIVLWELLTNCPPFKGMGMNNMQAAMEQRPSVKNIPNNLVPLLQSCGAENPANRPEFTEIITSLSEFLDTLESEHGTPLQKNAIDHQDYSPQVDSPATRHLMDESGEAG